MKRLVKGINRMCGLPPSPLLPSLLPPQDQSRTLAASTSPTASWNSRLDSAPDVLHPAFGDAFDVPSPFHHEGQDPGGMVLSRSVGGQFAPAGISHPTGTLLGVCRKGRASAPPKPRLSPFVRPAPPTACGCKLWGAGLGNNSDGAVTAGLNRLRKNPLEVVKK